MKESRAGVLVVDDYEPWRRFVTSTLHQHPELLIIGEVADGLAAVQKAQELQPDLILLDIGLPTLNGIEAARQIRELAPNSKILFISENRSREIANEALRTGAGGYFVKSDAARELLPAIRAVLQGQQFVGASMADYHLAQTSPVAPLHRQKAEIFHHHEVGFYSDECWLLDRVTQFIGAALGAGNAAVVAATEPHRESLVPKLQAYGVDVGTAFAEGRYLAADAADTLSTFMVNGMPDPVRFMEAFGDVIRRAAKASRKKQPRVAVFGECVCLLCEQGNIEAAIQMEKLGNRLTDLYNLDILCGYSIASVPDGTHSPAFQRICAEHSAAYSY